jgi:hypothetical protein
MALMAAHGEITPMPECAIFADTQAESEATYDWLAWLSESLPFPIHVVSAGSLEAHALAGKTLSGHDFQDIPWRTRGGMGRRQCTARYKILPLYRKLKELGATAKEPVDLWVGISTDEAQRMKPARVQYVRNVYPLIERGLSRLHCLRWLSDRAYPRPPKSSCVFCPYKGNAEWRELSDRDFARAVTVDEAIRGAGINQYAHRSLVPLSEADIRDEHEGQTEMFAEECEGMCGV